MRSAYQLQVEAGNAPDAYAGLIVFIPVILTRATYVKVKLWDAEALMRLSYDGLTLGDEFELDPDDPPLFVPFAAAGFDVRNKVAGSVARYEVTAYFGD